MEKRNKVIVTILVIVLAILAAVFGFLIYNQDQQNQDNQEKQTNANQPISVENQEQPSQDNQQQEEIKEEKKAVKNITGTLTSVDIGAVKVKSESGEDLTLTVPQEGASFYKQTKTGENSYTEEEIGLFDLPTDKQVQVQYDSNNDELLMVIVE